MKVVTAKQMQELDRLASTKHGIPTAQLMERAGEQLVAALRAHAGSLTDKRIVIAAGKGNNGGDGMVLARLLQPYACTVETYLAADGPALRGLVQEQWQRLQQTGGPSCQCFDLAGWTMDPVGDPAGTIRPGL